MAKEVMKWNRDAFEPVNEECIRDEEQVQPGEKVQFVFIHEDDLKEECELIYHGFSYTEDKQIIHFGNEQMNFELHISDGTGEEFGWIERLQK